MPILDTETALRDIRNYWSILDPALAPQSPSTRNVSFTLDIEPLPKARGRTVSKGGRTWTFTPKTTMRCEQQIRRAARRAMMGQQPFSGAVILHAEFTRSTQRSCDLDNLLKCLLDAIRKVVYLDDSQIIEIRAVKRYEAKRPQIAARISECSGRM